jgi:hypothetical protein
MMRWTKELQTAVLLLVVVSVPGCAENVTHRVKVTVVRRESSIHSSVANRDSYLIQVTPKSGKVFMARMIDEYPPYEDTLPLTSVNDGAGFSVALRRAAYCDDGLTTSSLDSSMRCFAVVHGSWKVPKGQLRDEWWK